MNSNLIAEVGRALFGERWQTDMANALGVSDRTMRRWAANAEPIKSGVYLDLHRLCLERAQTLDELAEKLKSV